MLNRIRKKLRQLTTAEIDRVAGWLGWQDARTISATPVPLPVPVPVPPSIRRRGPASIRRRAFAATLHPPPVLERVTKRRTRRARRAWDWGQPDPFDRRQVYMVGSPRRRAADR